MFIRYLLAFFILIVLILQFVKPQSKSINNIISDISSLNFAGEKVPMDGKYILNQERFDREFLSIKENVAQFILTYKRQGLYLNYIEKQLKKAGLPDDLKYIAMIESNLKNNVVSSAGAVGLRQFMPATAIKYGLIVDDTVDQRNDAYLSTDAAIKYFKDIYPIFNNWTLVAAAYNRGENGLQLDMQNQSQSGYYDLYLNNETYRFVFRIIAMKYLMENKYSYFTAQELGSQYDIPRTKEISMNQIDNLISRCKDNGYSYLEVKQLNPRIRKNTLANGDWKILVFKR